MTDLNATLSAALVERYTSNAARVRELAEQVDDQQFWQKPLPFGNSFGHLVLHLTGNLNYYIGAQIANTGYVRDRPREFNEANPPTKVEALRRFDEAVATTIRAIRDQSGEDWSAPYSAVGSDLKNRLAIVIQCAAHMQHHIGQMIYLTHAWKRNAG